MCNVRWTICASRWIAHVWRCHKLANPSWHTRRRLLSMTSFYNRYCPQILGWPKISPFGSWTTVLSIHPQKSVLSDGLSQLRSWFPIQLVCRSSQPFWRRSTLMRIYVFGSLWIGCVVRLTLRCRAKLKKFMSKFGYSNSFCNVICLLALKFDLLLSYREFLKPGAPCEINIDGKTMESVLKGLKNPSRFTFDSASEHIYTLLLKKDCYPRFIRSDHYKRLLEAGVPPSHKKRFFNFGGVGGAKKKMTAALSSQPNFADGTTPKNMGAASGSIMPAPPPGSLARRRGSDRSLTGSAHELAVIGVNKDITSKVPHSHSQSNLSEMPYRWVGWEICHIHDILCSFHAKLSVDMTREINIQYS